MTRIAAHWTLPANDRHDAERLAQAALHPPSPQPH